MNDYAAGPETRSQLPQFHVAHTTEDHLASGGTVAEDHHRAALEPSSGHPGALHAASTSVVEDDYDDLEIPSIDASIEERLQYLLGCAQSVGFDSFDAVLSAYYTLDVDRASGLVLEQRMSRVRRLPNLLADLRREAPTWRPREQSGYQNETVKAAEDICASECRVFLSRRKDTDQTPALSEETSLSLCQGLLEEEVSNLCVPWSYIRTRNIRELTNTR